MRSLGSESISGGSFGDLGAFGSGSSSGGSFGDLGAFGVRLIQRGAGTTVWPTAGTRRVAAGSVSETTAETGTFAAGPRRRNRSQTAGTNGRGRAV
ncbi:MAG: hypothetical protein IJY15_05445, partial [Thermoguttaceae bacterium]|nr:hypothetical protein [Thermoguttaceae bacterium]